jgi:hypothetical protein
VFRRRDHLVMQLSCQLADSRAREAALRERLAWYQTVVGESPVPLRAVRDDVRDSAQVTSP